MKIIVKIGNCILHQSAEVRDFEWIDETVKVWNALPEPLKNQFRADYASAAAQRIEELSHSVDYKSKRKLLMYQSIFNDNSIKCAISEQFRDYFLQTGFMRKELYVLSGISGGGKTALGILITAVLCGGYNTFLNNPTLKKTSVVYLSLEQTKVQIEARLMATLYALFTKKSINYTEILNGGHSCHDDLNLAFYLLEMCRENLKIIDKSDFDFEAPDVYRLKEELTPIIDHFNSNCLLIVDRYENIVGSNDYQNDAVARELKSLAEKKNIPILLQAQLNKSSIASGKKADGGLDYNKLSANSLKGTSGLEHHSTNVMIIVPEGRTRTVDGQEENLIRIIQPKSRYGANNSILMYFRGGNNLFFDYIENRGRKKKEESKHEKPETNND